MSTTLAENGSSVILKVVNPTDQDATLRIKGDWTSVGKTNFDYYAPGALAVANSMENKQAVALQHTTAKIDGNDVVLTVPALSAGVLTIAK